VGTGGTVLSSTNSNWALPLTVGQTTLRNRRPSFSTGASTVWCGGNHQGVTVLAGSGLTFDMSCGATSGTYFDVKGGVIIFDKVGPVQTQAPVKLSGYATGVGVSGGKVEVYQTLAATTTGIEYTVTLMEVRGNNPDQCNAWSNSMAHGNIICNEGMVCDITSEFTSPASVCIVSFHQKSQVNFWWLLFLLFVPCLFCSLLIWKFTHKKKPKPPPNPQAVVIHTPEPIPAPTPMTPAAPPPVVQREPEPVDHAPPPPRPPPAPAPEPKPDTSNLRPWIGAAVKWLDDGKGGRDNVCIVQAVTNGSPAGLAGIQEEDWLQMWDDDVIETASFWKSKAKAMTIGDVVGITLVRNGVEHRVQLEITGTERELGRYTVTSENVLGASVQSSSQSLSRSSQSLRR